MYRKIFTFVAVVAIALILPACGSSDTQTVTEKPKEGSIEDLQAQIKQLQKQIAELSPEELEKAHIEAPHWNTPRLPDVGERVRFEVEIEGSSLEETIMKEARRNSPEAVKRAADEFLRALRKEQAQKWDGILHYYEGTH